MWPFSACLSHRSFPVPSAEPGEPPCITSAGFQFLLLDTPAQLWYFMLQYLQTAQVRGGSSQGPSETAANRLLPDPPLCVSLLLLSLSLPTPL